MDADHLIKEIRRTEITPDSYAIQLCAAFEVLEDENATLKKEKDRLRAGLTKALIEVTDLKKENEKLKDRLHRNTLLASEQMSELRQRGNT